MPMPNSGEPIRDKGNVEVQWRRIPEAIGRLEGLTSQLDSRIEPILRPASPMVDTDEPPVAQSTQSELSSMMEQEADRLQRLNDRLQDIIERIDL